MQRSDEGFTVHWVRRIDFMNNFVRFAGTGGTILCSIMQVSCCSAVPRINASFRLHNIQQGLCIIIVFGHRGNYNQKAARQEGNGAIDLPYCLMR